MRLWILSLRRCIGFWTCLANLAYMWLLAIVLWLLLTFTWMNLELHLIIKKSLMQSWLPYLKGTKPTPKPWNSTSTTSRAPPSSSPTTPPAASSARKRSGWTSSTWARDSARERWADRFRRIWTFWICWSIIGLYSLLWSIGNDITN